MFDINVRPLFDAEMPDADMQRFCHLLKQCETFGMMAIKEHDSLILRFGVKRTWDNA